MTTETLKLLILLGDAARRVLWWRGLAESVDAKAVAYCREQETRSAAQAERLLERLRRTE